MEKANKDSMQKKMNVSSCQQYNRDTKEQTTLDRDTVILQALQCICGGSMATARELLGNG
jgi:hypothetical protein